MRARPGMCSSDHRPTSPWLIRPSARDAGGLDDHQPEAAEREPPEVDQVVVADQAVGDRVLAHRGDDEAVAQGQSAHGQGLEEGGGAHEM